MGVQAVELQAEGISVLFDPTFGNAAELRVEQSGRTISMLHRAPWVDDPAPVQV